MSLLVKVRRLGYRTAFRLLQGYWFVVRPKMDGVKCVIADHDRVLLVRHTYGSRAWDLPGGGLKRGETPLAAAAREMQEELGLGPAQWRSLGELRGRVNYRHETVHFFATELSAPQLQIDLGELAEVRWFQAPDLPDEVGPYVDQIMARLPGLDRAT